MQRKVVSKVLRLLLLALPLACWQGLVSAQVCYVDSLGVMYCEFGNLGCVEDESGNVFCPATPERRVPLVVTNLSGVEIVYEPLEGDELQCIEVGFNEILCPVGYLRCYENDRGEVFCPAFTFNESDAFIIQGMGGFVEPEPLNCIDDVCSNFNRIPEPPPLTQVTGPENPPLDFTIDCGFGSDGTGWGNSILVLVGMTFLFFRRTAGKVQG